MIYITKSYGKEIQGAIRTLPQIFPKTLKILKNSIMIDVGGTKIKKMLKALSNLIGMRLCTTQVH